MTRVLGRRLMNCDRIRALTDVETWCLGKSSTGHDLHYSNNSVLVECRIIILRDEIATASTLFC